MLTPTLAFAAAVLSAGKGPLASRASILACVVTVPSPAPLAATLGPLAFSVFTHSCLAAAIASASVLYALLLKIQ